MSAVKTSSIVSGVRETHNVSERISRKSLRGVAVPMLDLTSVVVNSVVHTGFPASPEAIKDTTGGAVGDGGVCPRGQTPPSLAARGRSGSDPDPLPLRGCPPW